MIEKHSAEMLNMISQKRAEIFAQSRKLNKMQNLSVSESNYQNLLQVSGDYVLHMFNMKNYRSKYCPINETVKTITKMLLKLSIEIIYSSYFVLKYILKSNFVICYHSNHINHFHFYNWQTEFITCKLEV